jgi:MoaA/NifB/PqqE/SkfB family radical SAM enzyme
VWDLATRGRYSFTFDLMPYQVSGLTGRARRNLAAAGLNLLWRRARPYAWPLYMQVELSSTCMLRCPACPTGSGAITRPNGMFEVDMFERLMDEVGEYLLVLALWAWGEPLLHPRLAEILRIASRYPATTLLSTNGQRLDDPMVRQALADHPPTYLIVSIDGLTDETNSRYRRGARLEPVLAGVRWLAEMKRRTGQTRPILHMRYLVMKHNQHELSRVREFAAGHGFDFLSLRGVAPICTDPVDHEAMLPDAGAYRPYEYTEEGPVRRDDWVCQIAFLLPAVLADGTVTACDQDFNGSAALGSIADGRSFRDVWFGARAAQVRTTIRDHRELLAFCRACPFENLPCNHVSIEAFALNPEVIPPVVGGFGGLITNVATPRPAHGPHAAGGRG